MEAPQINPADYQVLVCDDEESIRSALGDALKEWGFGVATSPSGEAALEYIYGGNVPHIVITDIRMLGMSGLELAQKIKEYSEEIEVIIMTSHGSFDTAVQALRLGVHDYLSKPFDDLNDVRNVLMHVCQRIYMRFYTEFLFEELKRKTAEIDQLARISTELSQTLEIPRLLQIAVSGLSLALGFSPVAFFQLNPVQKSLIATIRFPEDVFGKAQVAFPIPLEVADNVSRIVHYLGELGESEAFQSRLTEAEAMSPLTAKSPDPSAKWIVLPLVTRGMPRGVFVMRPAQLRGDESRVLLERYMQTIGTALENAILHSRVVESAVREPLTGLFNVRHFKERFQAELLQGKRFHHPVSLIFFDVDHFKKYNDTHGHPAGDEVLRRMGELLRRSFRKTDIVARYGGEEFVVVMPHTGFPDALAKAEKFRKAVEEAPFPNEHTQPLGRVTVSIGVSEFPSHGNTIEGVIKAADDALYDAKKKSRNVVVPAKAPEGYVPPFQSQQVRSKPLPPGSPPQPATVESLEPSNS